MQHQPSLFSSDPTPEPRSRPRPDAAREPDVRAASPWLRSLEVWVRIIVQFYVGALIVVLPWLRFWSENNLFTYSPALAALGNSGFLRGAVSGLGILNIYLAIAEALNFRRS